MAAKRKKKAAPKSTLPFAGKTVALFGEFAVWPSYHGGTPAELAKRLGAKVVDRLDERTDLVVFGDRKGTGRAEAKKKAERLLTGPKVRLTMLDEAAFRELVRIDLRGKRFAFVGGFDCAPEDGLLKGMVEGVGATLAEVDESLDYLVVGNRRGPSKVALQNKAKALNEAGAHISLLDESAFLELVRTDAPQKTSGSGQDFAGFISQLYGNVNEGKLGRALDMLRTDRFKLFARLDEQHLVGVVRSQSGSGSVYASWLTPEGKYGCSQPDLSECMGLQGSACKHLLVLVVGLAQTGQLPLGQAMDWIRATSGKPPKKNNTLCAETFVQYKGAEAGQLDWRPTETVPEDFYAL